MDANSSQAKELHLRDAHQVDIGLLLDDLSSTEEGLSSAEMAKLVMSGGRSLCHHNALPLGC